MGSARLAVVLPPGRRSMGPCRHGLGGARRGLHVLRIRRAAHLGSERQADVTREPSVFGNILEFQGQVYDDLTGDLLLRAREYQPAWGRFFSPIRCRSTPRRVFTHSPEAHPKPSRSRRTGGNLIRCRELDQRLDGVVGCGIRHTAMGNWWWWPRCRRDDPLWRWHGE